MLLLDMQSTLDVENLFACLIFPTFLKVCFSANLIQRFSGCQLKLLLPSLAFFDAAIMPLVGVAVASVAFNWRSSCIDVCSNFMRLLFCSASVHVGEFEHIPFADMADSRLSRSGMLIR